MTLNLLEVRTAGFHTTRDAFQQCERLSSSLGYKPKYLVARLAIARSLALPDAPAVDLKEADEDSGNTIRGIQLFGEEPDASAWVSLLVQRAGSPNLSRRDLQKVVSAHWKRGAQLLTVDWESAGNTLARFVERLASAAGLPETSLLVSVRGHVGSDVHSDPVSLPIGEIAEDADSGERVTFPLNAPGGSPHMALMGGAGSGKTRTAAHMLRAIRDVAAIPMLAFDFKGDLASAYHLDEVFSAQVLTPPRGGIPLDVLALTDRDDVTLKETAARFRDSFARIKRTALGGQQGDLLREAVLNILRVKPSPTISDIREAVRREYERLGRKADEMLATLNELSSFVLFEPKHKPADFFTRSWIISLPPATSDSLKKLVVNLTLDALDRWLNSMPESGIVGGFRGLRHLCLIDEAHQILETRLPALGNLVRMSRSKGGVIMLISQSPNDFSNEEDDFLDNVGLTLAFNTQAQAGPTKRIFGQSQPLASLAAGEALSRVRLEARTRRVTVWR